MSASQRRKGAEGERSVAELLRVAFPEARRRPSGAECQIDAGRDLDGTGSLVVQVAVGARPNPLKKLGEAEGAAKAGEIPVAFVRRDRGRHAVCLRADDFLALLLAARRTPEPERTDAE